MLRLVLDVLFMRQILEYFALSYIVQNCLWIGQCASIAYLRLGFKKERAASRTHIHRIHRFSSVPIGGHASIILFRCAVEAINN